MAASPTSNLSSPSVIMSDSEVEQSKQQDVDSSENSSFRSLTSPYNQQVVTNDATSPPPYGDIPQWKKDLIQRRKTNIAKTIAANQGIPSTANSSKASATTSVLSAALSPTSESTKSSQLITNNNKCDKLTIRASTNPNTIHDTKIHTSQHSIASALNLNNMLKMPATLQQQQVVEIESCGGHYTQVNNKSSGGGSHNYNEKLAAAAARTASIIQPEQPPIIPMTRSLAAVVEQQNRNDGGGSGSSSSSSTLAQENVKFRKNLTEQHETTNTTSSDSLITSTSRLSSSLKVAAAAEIYKKSNKDHLSVCVGEQQTHILQQEPALTTNVSNNTNNSGNGGGDDEKQLHHQLKSEQESDSLSCASVNVASPKEEDSKLFPINNNNNNNNSNVNGISSLSPKGILNKKQCGIANASVRLAAPATLSSSQYIKNQNISSSSNNSNLVSSHHNHKINTKYRSSQNSPPALSATTESPTTTVTNNKKKMVAVQEMNEITNNELDFDPSEELQYGPGIVSKLRCRYLSLALRQSMGKQRLSMDSLRRATSLNNLLDDNDVHDEDEDEEEDETLDHRRNKEATSPTLVSVPPQVGIVDDNPSNSTTADTVVGFKKNSKNNSGERITGTTLAYSHQNRSRHIKRGNDSLKRARSVEALLCEKSPWNFSNSQPTMSGGAADSVTIEDKINNARDRLVLGTDHPPKRLTSIIDDTERPPPDLVKQTLKIFEASANRRGRIPSRNSGGEVANKVANYKSIITQNKPAITFPKPVSPKKSNLKKPSPEIKKAVVVTPPTTPTVQATDKSLVPHSSTPAASSRTTPAFRPKMDFTPIKSAGCVVSGGGGGAEGLSENSPDIIPRHKLLDKTLPTSIAVDSLVTGLPKKNEKLRIESPSTIQVQQQQLQQQQQQQQQQQPQQPLRKELQSKFSNESSDRDSDDDDDDDDSIDGEYIVNSEEFGSTKQISKSALENIAKAGTSQQFQFQTKSSVALSNGNSLASKLSEPLHDIPTLPISGTTTVKQIGVIRPLVAEPQYLENTSNIGCTEGNTSTQSTSLLTSREIEKNRINNEKKIEKLGSTNSQMDELGGSVGFAAKVNKNIASSASTSESNDTAQAPAWSSAIINKKKRNPVGAPPENNTMVFNFKDRKEVPDYIENDGLIFKRKRELPKPNESGFVLLGDLSLETSTDPDDEWPMCPPSPCDVEFENANILIDGKSSIKNRSKDAHFRVQFNDTLTSTFEYPSESSVIEDSGSEYADLSGNTLDISSSASAAAPMHILGNLSHEIDPPIIHHHVAVEEIIQLPHNNKVLGNLSLGSAPLGSYTPVKAKTENIFQLGVTRVPNSQADKSGDEVKSKKEILPAADYYGELDDPSLEYLKPASDDLTIAYSEGSLKTDLLY